MLQRWRESSNFVQKSWARDDINDNAPELLAALCQRVRAAEKSLHDSEMECLGMQGRVERAEAESARLREALLNVSVHSAHLPAAHQELLKELLAKCGNIARAALGRPSEPRT